MQPFIIIVAILIALMLFYFARFRPWQLRWGATDDEIRRAMLGDDIVGDPSFDATRAV